MEEIQQSRDGDASPVARHGRWLDALARRYSPALHRFFSRKVDQSTDVPDLVQDVFLRLARLAEPGKIMEPENYLFKTASNTLRDYLRRKSVRKHLQQADCDAEIHGGFAFTPDEILEGRQVLERLQVVLTELPDRTRDVFVLKALEGEKTGPIARYLGISTRAVEKHYAKALVHIATALATYKD